MKDAAGQVIKTAGWMGALGLEGRKRGRAVFQEQLTMNEYRHKTWISYSVEFGYINMQAPSNGSCIFMHPNRVAVLSICVFLIKAPGLNQGLQHEPKRRLKAGWRWTGSRRYGQ
jgi:hypothetical protein